ncbi:Protein of unknown function [Pyronema omphalodes CBS 100304]|uniref:Uncharacterized protein n=1 Tax=Pyronema omphalodes (strain CBS 100304) TaxID=1076935 RepID=U4L570_PYROM|nr:Protein of unknown function [Pyronema omphalodes CBS 100304]
MAQPRLLPTISSRPKGPTGSRHGGPRCDERPALELPNQPRLERDASEYVPMVVCHDRSWDVDGENEQRWATGRRRRARRRDEFGTGNGEFLGFWCCETHLHLRVGNRSAGGEKEVINHILAAGCQQMLTCGEQQHKSKKEGSRRTITVHIRSTEIHNSQLPHPMPQPGLD